jgi:hypothetical protein
MRPPLESIEATRAMRDLIKRRTDWIALDFINFQRSFQTALANAYIAGMNDALDTMARSSTRGP